MGQRPPWPIGGIEPIAWERCDLFSAARIVVVYASALGSVIDAVSIRFQPSETVVTLYERTPPDIWPDGTVGAVANAFAVHCVACPLSGRIAPDAILDGCAPSHQGVVDDEHGDPLVQRAIVKKAPEPSSCPSPALACALSRPR